MFKYKKYLIVFILLFLISITGYAGLTYIVDPYGFYRPTDRGFFPIKPAMPKNQNMTKANIIAQLRPDTVIVGSSRIDYGINPNHPAFAGHTVYNAGLKGIRQTEQDAFIRHAVHHGATHIIWGLDFFTFNVNVPVRDDFNEDRFKDGYMRDWLTLISLSSLKPTLQTMLYRDCTDISSVDTNGMTTGVDLDKKIADKGMHQMFADDAATYLRRIYFPFPDRNFTFKNDTDNAFESFERTLSFLKESNVKVTLFIPPVHAYLYSLIYQTRLLPDWITWHKTITTIARNYEMPIYDFTALNQVTFEPIGTDMRYWWEASHFKPIIGYAMISEILLEQRNVVPGFGGSTKIFYTIFNDQLRRYQCDNPLIVSNLRKLVKDSGLEKRLIQPLNCP